MAGNNPSEFRFDGNDQEAESIYQEEFKDLRLERLSQRLTFLMILLPCLTAVALYFGYQDLSGKFSRNNDSGSQEIQRLTEELEDLSQDFNQKLITFSTTLSSQDEDFGTSVKGRLFTINKDIGMLQQDFKSLNEEIRRNLKQNTATIEKLQSSKADKKSQAVAVEKINANIKPLMAEIQKLKTVRRDLKAISGDMAKLEKKLTANLAALADEARQTGANNAQMQATLAELSSKTIDKDALALEIFKLKKKFQSQISREVANINQRLDTIRLEVDRTETIVGPEKKSLKKISKETVPRQASSGRKSTTAKPGTITEKDLIE
ncbi:hypothetical protein D1AOALGA4SA_10371 [Olavius algarvensis Delta 1 endosymbiont]|nr:hypothetical protein D1AOALGA4SA_10371 [Olavius algarvensis Delta 1 endosymbiont]